MSVTSIHMEDPMSPWRGGNVDVVVCDGPHLIPVGCDPIVIDGLDPEDSRGFDLCEDCRAVLCEDCHEGEREFGCNLCAECLEKGAAATEELMAPVNPYYAAYAASQGRSPADQLAFDRGQIARMAPFIVWISGQWRTFHREIGCQCSYLAVAHEAEFTDWLRGSVWERAS